MEGFLTKKGHQFKTWQKRWFVLEKHRLCYYEKENKKNLKGTYILSASAYLVRAPDEGNHKNLFVLHAEGSGGQHLVMSAASPEQLAEWEEGINGMINQYKVKRKKSVTKDEKADTKPAAADVPAVAAAATPAPEPAMEVAAVVASEPTPEPVKEPEVVLQATSHVPYTARAAGYTPRVVVLGSSGSVGQATVMSLSAMHAPITISAGTRSINSAKAAEMSALPGVVVVSADMAASRAILAAELATADRVFIVAPGSEDRADIAINSINACRDAGVGYMLILSVRAVVQPETVFGAQFNLIEAAAVKSGIPHTIIRLPFFLDNALSQLHLMVNNSQFYLPVGGNKKYNSVAISDVGEVCAKILADPTPVVGSTLDLTGALNSENDTAAAFSAALCKPVEFVQVPYDAAKSSMLGMGVPEWQVNGIIELFQLVEASDPSMCVYSSDMEMLLGRPPISITDFANRYKITPDEKEVEAVSTPVAVYTARTPSDPPVVVVLGSSGSVGIAALTNLGEMTSPSMEIRACVRDVASVKMKAISHISHVNVVAGDMGQPDTLKGVLADADRVLVVTPGAEHRADLAINAINACKEAGVGYMVVLSVLTVERPGTIFAEQFLKIEAAAAASGIPHTIIRVPFFLDNILGQLQLMMNTGKYYGPISPSSKHNSIAVSDVGEALAKILADPNPYVGRVIELCGPLVSEAETAAAFSAGLGNPVEYIQVPYAAAKSSMIELGFPEWKTDGIMEMYQMIESEDGLLTTHHAELEAILGHPAVSIVELARPVEFTDDAPSKEQANEEVKGETTGEEEVEEEIKLETKLDSIQIEVKEEVKEPDPVKEVSTKEIAPVVQEVVKLAPVVVAKTTPAPPNATPEKRAASSNIDSLFTEGLMVLKKTGAETRYQNRFVWIDMGTATFNWSKVELEKSSSKNIPLSTITGVTGPEFEKKTGRRNSILGGGNVEDGHVISLQQDNGFTIDLKITEKNRRTSEEWKDVFDTLVMKNK